MYPTIFIFFGLVASGKSTLATAWAGRHGLARYNSDVVRKELAGLDPAADRREAFDRGIYSADFTRRTYEALREKAGAEITAGRSTVLDASYQDRQERRRVCSLATGLQCGIQFILCTCPEPELQRRLRLRAQDPTSVSDGRWEIYLKQKDRFDPPAELDTSELTVINTTKPVERLLAELDSRLPTN